MKKKWVLLSTGILTLSFCAMASAADLTIHLKGSQPITESIVQYQCDGNGEKMGLPADTFSVRYINGAGNSLAVLPIRGELLIFSNVVSGSGARYAAGPFIWWDASGRSVSLSSDSLAGKMRSECHRLNLEGKKP